MGHGLVLQFPDCLVVPHDKPPFDGRTRIERVRYRVPPPQVLLQEAHEAQEDSWQCTGHERVLQFRENESVGHLRPPYLG
jgi:hypothetical protein